MIRSSGELWLSERLKVVLSTQHDVTNLAAKLDSTCFRRHELDGKQEMKVRRDTRGSVKFPNSKQDTSNQWELKE